MLPFMNDIENLCLLLDKQIALQKKLFDLENQKSEILIKGKIDQLDNLVNLEQPFIMSTSNIEKQRDSLQRKMGLEGVTLRQIVKEYSNSADNALENKFNELTDIVLNLKKVNRTNQKILNSRLEVVEFVLFEIGYKSNEVVTYKKLLKK
jgi:flagellar biosynthesis/type III secretory pathway chaperone